MRQFVLVVGEREIRDSLAVIVRERRDRAFAAIEGPCSIEVAAMEAVDRETEGSHEAAVKKIKRCMFG